MNFSISSGLILYIILVDVVLDCMSSNSVARVIPDLWLG